jgi:hypothetical protein
VQLSLTRVRVAFAACTMLLLFGTWSLLNSALDRLERERRLRHEVVAERVFDELERELSAYLERESARPSAAYDASSEVQHWAPFVVGYFTVDDAYHLLSRDQLAAARAQRLESALARVWPNPSAPPVQPDPSLVQKSVPELSKKSRSKLKAMDDSPEVLRRLNRAQDSRQAPSNDGQDPFAF